MSRAMRRAAWAGAALLVLSACSEGYQGDGEPLHLHYDMSQQSALDAMGEVVRSAGDSGSAFALREHCVLEWREGKRVLSTPLLGTQAVLHKPEESEGYRVQLSMAAEADDAPRLELLDEAPWTEATQLKWLLDYVRRFC